jgi:SAM-dependent methyltransferase
MTHAYNVRARGTQPGDERYAPGYGPRVRAMLDARTAASSVGFLLPLLGPGMRVLDAGCGAGSITAGLAATGAELVGVDMSAAELERARSRGVPGATFVQASVYRLPFADASFDAAVAHALLEHLANPAAALTELRRVLRPRGVLAVASSDWSAAIVEPRTADVETALAAHAANRRRAGGDPDLGGHVAALLRAAGWHLVEEHRERREDLEYRALGAYIADGLAALGDPAAEAARRWAAGGPGRFEQCWVCLLVQLDDVHHD